MYHTVAAGIYIICLQKKARKCHFEAAEKGRENKLSATFASILTIIAIEA